MKNECVSSRQPLRLTLRSVSILPPFLFVCIFLFVFSTLISSHTSPISTENYLYSAALVVVLLPQTRPLQHLTFVQKSKIMNGSSLNRKCERSV